MVFIDLGEGGDTLFGGHLVDTAGPIGGEGDDVDIQGVPGDTLDVVFVIPQHHGFTRADRHPILGGEVQLPQYDGLVH